MLSFEPSCIPGAEEYVISMENNEFTAESGVVDESGNELSNIEFIYSLADHYDARVCIVPARDQEAREHNSRLQRSGRPAAERAASFMFSILLQRPIK